MESVFYDVMRYIWPLFTLFQLVVTIIAVQKLKGTGPTLMVVGTGLIVLRTAINFFPFDQGFDAGGSASFWSLQAISIIGRLLFLVGLLLMVQKDYKVREPALGRTEF